jgi:hypothetical protein
MLRNGLPHAMGEISCQHFIDQVDWPENIVDEQQNKGMVIIPAYHE